MVLLCNAGNQIRSHGQTIMEKPQQTFEQGWNVLTSVRICLASLGKCTRVEESRGQVKTCICSGLRGEEAELSNSSSSSTWLSSQTTADFCPCPRRPRVTAVSQPPHREPGWALRADAVPSRLPSLRVSASESLAHGPVSSHAPVLDKQDKNRNQG